MRVGFFFVKPLNTVPFPLPFVSKSKVKSINCAQRLKNRVKPSKFSTRYSIYFFLGFLARGYLQKQNDLLTDVISLVPMIARTGGRLPVAVSVGTVTHSRTPHRQ